MKDWKTLIIESLEYYKNNRWSDKSTIRTLGLTVQANEILKILNTYTMSIDSFYSTLETLQNELKEQKNISIKQKKYSINCRLFLIQWVMNSINGGINKYHPTNICKPVIDYRKYKREYL